ncbi:MAG: Grx4 family monothiol glutaredoxin [Alphaproteobacteria bacterium]|nr:Grx4 family monothiol glutaredoxin [Alphaproteobacteria bacterium]
MTQAAFEQIQGYLDNNDVVLFMKGTAGQPQCGFSYTVSQILSGLGVSFRDVNILEEQEVRLHMKDFSQWPTFPQLFVKGELVGGCDIVREMAAEGELQALLDEKGIAYNKSAA